MLSLVVSKAYAVVDNTNTGQSNSSERISACIPVFSQYKCVPAGTDRICAHQNDYEIAHFGQFCLTKPMFRLERISPSSSSVCDANTQSCPRIQPSCDPLNTSCNPPPCNPNTTSCQCNTLDDEVNNWITPLFSKRVVSEYSSEVTPEKPTVKYVHTWKTPSQNGELNKDILLGLSGRSDKPLKLRVQFVTKDSKEYVIGTLIDFLGPKPTIAWQWYGILQSNGVGCSISSIGG